MSRYLLSALLLASTFVLAGCAREERELRPSPAASQVVNETQVSGINPGANPLPAPPTPQMYEESAYEFRKESACSINTTVRDVMRMAGEESARR
jgi:nitrous oxide reductase accessory protein NosL